MSFKIWPKAPARVLGWAAVPFLLVLVLSSGCGRVPLPATAPRSDVFQEVMARRQVFRGLEVEGRFTVKHNTESITIPLEIRVSEDFRLEIRGEISHFLLPFQGEFTLVSGDETTLLHTNIGTYDLAMDPKAQPAVRAFLLSLAGGGDWLLWWLAENNCATEAHSSCHGLEIELEPHSRLPSIGRWEIKEPAEGGFFTARVEEYEPGSLVPHAIKGTLYPQEMTIYLEYSEITGRPAPAR